MKKNILLAILCVLALVILVFLILDILENGFDFSRMMKPLLVLCGSVISFIKVLEGTSSNKKSQYEVYKNQYSDLIRQAFLYDKKLLKRLFDAIDDYNRNKYGLAIRKLTNLMSFCKYDDDYCAVLMFRALAYSDKNDTQSAIDDYISLLNRNSNNSSAWSNLGLIYTGKGMYNEAVNAFEKALEIDNKNEYAYNNLSAVYLRQNKFNEAIEYAKKALDIKSNFYQAANTLSIAYLSIGNYEESKKYYNISVMNGGNANGLTSALNSVKQGDFFFCDVLNNEKILKAIAEFKNETSVTYAKIIASTKDTTKSCLGGDTQNPPVDSNGKPMSLLCAIYCSEVKGVPYFPESGIICFYIADNDLYGLNLDSLNIQKDFRVMYVEDENSMQILSSRSNHSEYFPVRERVQIEFELSEQSMTYADYKFNAAFSRKLEKFELPDLDSIDDNVHDFIASSFEESEMQIGGYPSFCQSDPREDEKYNKYDTLLLQISSTVSGDEELIMFGDSGVCNFFISQADLQNKIFSDVLYTWDCY